MPPNLALSAGPPSPEKTPFRQSGEGCDLPSGWIVLTDAVVPGIGQIDRAFRPRARLCMPLNVAARPARRRLRFPLQPSHRCGRELHRAQASGRVRQPLHDESIATFVKVDAERSIQLHFFRRAGGAFSPLPATRTICSAAKQGRDKKKTSTAGSLRMVLAKEACSIIGAESGTKAK